MLGGFCLVPYQKPSKMIENTGLHQIRSEENYSAFHNTSVIAQPYIYYKIFGDFNHRHTIANCLGLAIKSVIKEKLYKGTAYVL
jgi:hypothetical protein